MRLYDDARCWAKGGGSNGYTRDIYAGTDKGIPKAYTVVCNGYNNRYTVESVSSEIDHYEGSCHAIINGVSEYLVIN